MDKEQKRGIKSGKKFISEYRSFKTEGKNIYGYKKNGSKQFLVRKSDLRKNYSGKYSSWQNGFYGTIKEEIKSKPTRTRKPTNPYAFKMPNFKLGW